MSFTTAYVQFYSVSFNQTIELLKVALIQCNFSLLRTDRNRGKLCILRDHSKTFRKFQNFFTRRKNPTFNLNL